MADRTQIPPAGDTGSDRDGQRPQAPLDLRRSRDPWRDAPTEELQDQVLPRWFVLLAIGAVIAALVTVVVAITAIGSGAVPVAERRPPPAAGLTHAVGAFEVGDTDPVEYEDACPLLSGVRVAGTPTDRDSLRRGLAAACNVAEGDAAASLQAFAAAEGIVRFAAFEATGVDSVATTPAGSTPAGLDRDAPQILVNARYARSNPLQIAPLLIHDAIARTDPGVARTELTARIAEADACARLFDEPPRSCTDALELATSPTALPALRAAGYE